MKIRTQIWISAGILTAAAAAGLLLWHGIRGGEEVPPPEKPAWEIPMAEAEQDGSGKIRRPFAGDVTEILGIPDTAAVPDAEREAVISEEPEPEPENDPRFGQLLSEAGYAPEMLSGSQLIVVDAYGSEAELSCFELRDGAWRENASGIFGWVGTNGVSREKREGDGCTPAGLYSLGYGFGIEVPENVNVEYRPVTWDSYWVDDPDSAFYNTWAEGTENGDWSSAEQLAAYPSEYAFAVVIEYNTDPVEYGAGSAIFLHCGSESTAGCVAVGREQMLEILAWLTEDAEILIY